MLPFDILVKIGNFLYPKSWINHCQVFKIDIHHYSNCDALFHYIIKSELNYPIEILEKLIFKCRDLDSLLQLAAQNGRIDIVKTLSRNEEMWMNTLNPAADNNLALRNAVEGNNKKVVELLLKDKRVDPTDEDDCAMKTALRYGYTDIIMLLLKDDRIKKNYGFSG